MQQQVLRLNTSIAISIFQNDGGGTREICAPYVSLLECQRWINENILSAVATHECAVGYVIGRSIKNHALPHLGAKAVLTIDIEKFFPTIRFPRVVAIFHQLGYSTEVSTSLARLCCLDGVLPQGAPTSPALSNIVCNSLDRKLAKLSIEANLNYTRYADDMCFSGDHVSRNSLRLIEKTLASEGFKLNKTKTRLHSTFNNLKVVTGINVALEKLSLPKPFKREISKDLYHIEKYGLQSHLAKRKIRDASYLQSLLGKVGYWLFIEPDNLHAQHYRQVLMRFLSA